MNSSDQTFSLGQWNCRSILSKINDLNNFLPNLDILSLQETWLKENNNFSISNYNVIRKDRSLQSGGGLVILLKNHIPFQQLDINIINFKFEFIFVSFYLGIKKNHLLNIYNPPNNYVPLNHWLNLFNQVSHSFSNFIICGDFNAQHSLWGSDLLNHSGRTLAEALELTSLAIINDGSSTRIHLNPSIKSSPDLTLFSADLLSSTGWSIFPDSMGSDHSPIIINQIRGYARSCPSV